MSTRQVVANELAKTLKRQQMKPLQHQTSILDGTQCLSFYTDFGKSILTIASTTIVPSQLFYSLCLYLCNLETCQQENNLYIHHPPLSTFVIILFSFCIPNSSCFVKLTNQGILVHHAFVVTKFYMHKQLPISSTVTTLLKQQHASTNFCNNIPPIALCSLSTIPPFT